MLPVSSTRCKAPSLALFVFVPHFFFIEIFRCFEQHDWLVSGSIKRATGQQTLCTPNGYALEGTVLAVAAWMAQKTTGKAPTPPHNPQVPLPPENDIVGILL
jgi:hypothetical protein